MKLKAYKYRLKLTDKQSSKIRQFAGCCRFIYNKMLGIEKENYKNSNKLIGYNQATKLLVQWKKDSDTSFLKEVHSQILQQKIDDLYKAYKNYFSKRAELPRFKKRQINDSFRYPQGFEIDEKNKRISSRQKDKTASLRFACKMAGKK